jgi:hypothetical protein
VGELKFVFKTLFATIVVIALMQLKVGEKTIESKTYQILAHSEFAEFLNHVASGAVELGKQARAYAEEQLRQARK